MKMRNNLKIQLSAKKLIPLLFFFQFLWVSCGPEEKVQTPPPHKLEVLQLSDPLYVDQWHLKNTGQFGGMPGEDLNVEPAWDQCGTEGTCRGEGVVIAIVDGGTQVKHPDIEANFISGSFNYVTEGLDPTPTHMPRVISDHATFAHGTAIAGLTSARDQNGLGGKGVAPRSSLVAYDLLENESAFNEADAMTRGLSTVSVSVSSWGPADGLGTLDLSDALWQNSVDVGTHQGRNGLGITYVWAAGNGSNGSSYCPVCRDNSNYDGYANFRGVMAVGAVNNKGVKSSYSERGANLWVSAPGGEFCSHDSFQAIVTTDFTGPFGFNPIFAESVGTHDYPSLDYTHCMNGTSAAAPEVGGVVALVLQANPKLSWRDVRLILAQTARKNDPNDAGSSAFPGDQRDMPGWKLNGAGYHINHQYGFGVPDTFAAVNLAKVWTPIEAQKISEWFSARPEVAIPDDNSGGVADTQEVKHSHISKIEWIEIAFDSDHDSPGDLDISLTHLETGTISQLAETHHCLNINNNSSVTCTSYSHWIFSSGRHLGESADGTWKLEVRDLAKEHTGTLNEWSLKFYGR